ncbi:AAA family ATPase [Microbacterium sp. LRZ72]|uniref:ParA family protein n=1 Tax=Microbacterium sp. LRZ72 TaxID=2942481 RepID=UPI0029A94274|nr:AAA family ATPase [Microbacterium sp. LRZ72]MDX2377608.1 AAA family ATPase [Microbacterium sp. LRZ72]
MSTTTRPLVYAAVTGDTASFVSTHGRAERLEPLEGCDIRSAIVQRAIAEAQSARIDLELITSGDHGEHRLLVSQDGIVTGITANEALHNPIEETQDVAATHGPPASELPAPRRAARSERRSFIVEPSEGEPDHLTAWHALLRRFGITVRRSAEALRRAGDESAVAQHWAGCRTIAVVNGKGGVGKTMTTAMLSAVFARYGGGPVLAWDNNDTRGTLGWRTESGHYDSTVQDLLPAAEWLLSPDAPIADIANYVHHQTHDRYDVLRSNPELLAARQRIATTEFDLLMRVAARYFRLVVFDSGNDESAERWLRMVDSSYQLVIPTIAARESAESAALLLEALTGRDRRSADLARNATVVMTLSERVNPAEVRPIVEGFTDLVRAVHIIPFDPALKSGPLRFDALQLATRRAWVRTAASVAEQL